MKGDFSTLSIMKNKVKNKLTIHLYFIVKMFAQFFFTWTPFPLLHQLGLGVLQRLAMEE